MSATLPFELGHGLAGVPAGDVVAVVAQPEPSPSPSQPSFEPTEVSPGLAGFIPVFLIAVACVLLFLSLTRHLRRVTVRQAHQDAVDAERAAAERAVAEQDGDQGTR